MKVRRRAAFVAIVVAACGLLAAACSSSSPSAGGGTAARVQGGTATTALTASDGQFNFIYPMLSPNYDFNANISFTQYLMWRPLYWFGSPAHSGLNESESLAYPASVALPAARPLPRSAQALPLG